MKKFLPFILCITVAFVILTCSNNKITSFVEELELITLDVTEISENGATFNAKLFSKNSVVIKYYGFVWSEFRNPSIESSDKVISNVEFKSSSFSFTITTTLQEQRPYYVKSFLITEDSTIYGNEVNFISQGSGSPEIDSYTPLTGSWRDTLKISGKKFSFIKDKNIVKLGYVDVPVIESSDSLIIAVIPEIKNSDSAEVSVSIYGNYATADRYFKYLVPEITEVGPLRGTYNDTITISGKNFSKYTDLLDLQFSDVNADIISHCATQLQVVVPEKLTKRSDAIKFSSVGYKIIYKEPFVLNGPVTTSFEPDTVYKLNEAIIIHGDNFCPIPTNNIVEANKVQAEVLWSTNNRLAIFIPQQVLTFYNVTEIVDISLKVTVAEQSSTVPGTITLDWHSSWTRLSNFPGIARYNAVAFAVGEKGYFGTGVTDNDYEYLKDFWEYDPENDRWTPIDDFPGKARAGAVSFTLDNNGYVGTGSEHFYWSNPDDDKDHFNDFYCYDPQTKKWSQITDFEGVGRHSAASFVEDGKAYVGTGYWGLDNPYGGLKIADDIWIYDPATNGWSSSIKFPEQTNKAVGFSVGNEAFIYDYDQLYTLSQGGWQLLSAPNLGAWDNIAFSIDNLAYFGLGEPHQISGTSILWQYNPLTQESVKKAMGYNAKRWGTSVFVINKKAYIIGGVTYDNGIYTLNDVWLFDPTKP